MRKLLCSLLTILLILTLAACKPSEHDVEVRFEKMSYDGDEIAVEGEDLKATLEADRLYKLPQTIEVMVDGNSLDADEYSYDPDTGKLEIPAEAVTGEVELRAEAERISYEVSVDPVSGMTIQGETAAYPEQTYKAILIPQEYYLLCESVQIIVDGKELSDGDFTYDPSSGELVITAGITGDIVVSSDANPVIYALNTESVLGLILSDSSEQVLPSAGYNAVLSCAEGYVLPEAVEILVDGAFLDTSLYSYDPVTGQLSVPGASITGNMEIHAFGTALIAGTWSTQYDMSSMLNDSINASDPGMAAYFDFHDLYITIEFYLGADGTASLSVTEDSVEPMLDEVKDQMVDGIKNMLTELLQAQGLDMTADDYLAVSGMDLDALIDQSMNLDPDTLANLSYSGEYIVDGNKLFLMETGEEPDPDSYLLYTLTGDSLYVEAGTEADTEVGKQLFPLTLTRVSE